jgi:hypothetical protein
MAPRSTGLSLTLAFTIVVGCGGEPPKPEPVGRSSTPAKQADEVAKPESVLPPELVGTFRASGSIGRAEGKDERPMSWMKEYTFSEDGTWTLVGYPPIRQSGTMTVLAREAARIHVRIDRAATDQDPAHSSDHWIELSPDAQGFTIGEETYARIEKRRKR